MKQVLPRFLSPTLSLGLIGKEGVCVVEVREAEPAVTSVGLSGCLLSLVGKFAPLLPAESLIREVVPVTEDKSGVA